MVFLHVLKRILPSSAKLRIKVWIGFKTMEVRLRNLSHAGFVCTGAVDVGAYHGDWSIDVWKIWRTPLILVEPQVSCSADLKRIVSNAGAEAVAVEHCALGRQAGEVRFRLEETNSRMLKSDETEGQSSVVVQVKTLHDLMAVHRGRYNLLKVDVQGFELDVLEGAGDMLRQFEVIILEVSIIRIGPVPTFYEVMQYMDRKGYRLYDFLPMYYRPRGSALWQGDSVLVRNDSPYVSSFDLA